VTPSKSGYTFSPTSIAVTISGANQAGKNFTASASSGDTQLTSGVGVASSVTQGAWKYFYITVPSGATSLELKITGLSADVDLYTQYNAKPTSSTYACRPYSGGTTAETCTQASPSAGTWWAGVYGYAAGSFTVTGTYVLGGSTYSISGTVSGATASGVTMNLTGAATASATTDASGNYTFSNLANGSYTVTPSKSGYTFSPTSIAVTLSGANQTGKNFTASASGTCNAVAAAYNSTYGAPACASNGKSCEAGTGLLNYAGTSEPNDHNNTADSCADGTSGSYPGDEYIAGVKIATTDGTSCLAVGKTVTITVTAYCWGTADRVTVFYDNSVSNGLSWSKVGSTYTCPSAGTKTITFSTTLTGTAGTNQAVRAQLVYNYDPLTNACYSGPYNDRDDLVFKVQ